MFDVPESTFSVGEKVAVRVDPVPLMLLKVPPLMTTSPVLVDQTKLLPGSSLKVKVMAEVSPAFKVAISDAMLTLGDVVSTKYCGLLSIELDVMALALPIASLRVAPFRLSAFNATATPSVSVWPLIMLVLNTNAVPPEPEM